MKELRKAMTSKNIKINNGLVMRQVKGLKRFKFDPETEDNLTFKRDEEVNLEDYALSQYGSMMKFTSIWKN